MTTSGKRAYLIAAVASTLLHAGPGGGDRGIVASYELDCVLSPGESAISCDETILWTNPGPASVDDVALHLYLEAFRDEHTTYRREGEASGVSYEGWGGIDLESVAIDGRTVHPEVRGTGATVDVGRQVVSGDHVVLEIRFTSHLPVLVERTGCVSDFCFAGQWYPKVARLEADGRWPVLEYHHNAEYDAETARHEVRIEVPTGWQVAATGGATIDGGAYRFSGTFKDAAFAAGRDLETIRGTDRAGRIELCVAYPGARRDEALRTMELLGRALPILEQNYGAFAYPGLTVVIVPEDGRGAGGMEYPGLITTLGTDPSWSPVKVREPVLYHELMHQVFFGKLDTDEGREPWIDEGLATYSALRLQAAIEGTAGPVAGRLGVLSLDTFELPRAWLMLPGGWQPARRAAWDYPSRDDYGGAVYGRTAAVMETARRIWGDESIEDALGRLARNMGGRRIRGSDVERAFAAAHDEEFVQAYLAPALDSPVPLDLSIESIGDKVEVRRSGEIAVRAEVHMILASGERQVVVWDASRDRDLLAPPGGGRVVAAVLDPRGRILMDVNRLDNGLDGRAPDVGRPLSFLGLLLLLAQTLGSVVMP
jgi:hypothetical protein